ncbi:uncharacterized protein RHIMIDRAFT_293954, partial [Rhizopus microsporus ATCC 52813]
MLFKQPERSSAVYIIFRKKYRTDLSLFHTNCIIKTKKMRLYVLKRFCHLLLVSQLFLPYNDIAEFDWMENEYCLTEKRKWHGVLFLIDDHLITTALVELSGGLKKVSGTKELNDIEKFYENMLQLFDNIPESKQKRVFCARFY